MRTKQPAELADVLASVLDPVATGHRSAFRRLSLAWPSVCGAAVSRHTEPLALRDALLVIGVRGRHWREAVFHERRNLTNRLRRYWKPLRGIYLESLPVAPPAPAAPDRGPTEPDPRTAEIHDPALREATDALLAAVKRRP